MIEALIFFQTRKNNIEYSKNFSSALGGMVWKERKKSKRSRFLWRFQIDLLWRKVILESAHVHNVFSSSRRVIHMQIPWDIVHKLRHCHNCRVMCIMGKFSLRIGSFPVRKKSARTPRTEHFIHYVQFSCLFDYSVRTGWTPVVVKRGESVYKLKPTK